MEPRGRSFPKGPLYLLASPLAARIASARRTHQRLERTLASVIGAEDAPIKPWEDVYTGLSLAESVRASGGEKTVGLRNSAAASAPKVAMAVDDLVMVHMGCAVFTEMWGLFTTSATALWHMRTKVASRIGTVHRWAAAHHCALPSLTLRCQHRPWQSCSGARWLRCHPVYNYSACSFKLVNLLRGHRLPARRTVCWTPPFARGETPSWR